MIMFGGIQVCLHQHEILYFYDAMACCEPFLLMYRNAAINEMHNLQTD